MCPERFVDGAMLGEASQTHFVDRAMLFEVPQTRFVDRATLCDASLARFVDRATILKADRLEKHGPVDIGAKLCQQGHALKAKMPRKAWPCRLPNEISSAGPCFEGQNASKSMALPAKIADEARVRSFKSARSSIYAGPNQGRKDAPRAAQKSKSSIYARHQARPCTWGPPTVPLTK